MFGYVTTNRPELKIKEDQIYQQYYCGLCQILKKDYGRKAQLSLSNDLTFVYLLLSSLYEPQSQIESYRCPLHPTKKHIVLKNKYGHYASDMNMILTYYKCEDDMIDDHSIHQNIYHQLLKANMKKIKKKYPEKCTLIKKELEQIHHLEQNNCQDLDEISRHFGIIMGHIMIYDNDSFKDDLYQLGFYLGKFVYLLDAYDDIEEDIKKNHYNPLKNKYQNTDFEEKYVNILEMMMSECSFYFEKLPIIENSEILKNIIYSGVWTKYALIRSKRMEKKNESL